MSKEDGVFSQSVYAMRSPIFKDGVNIFIAEYPDVPGMKHNVWVGLNQAYMENGKRKGCEKCSLPSGIVCSKAESDGSGMRAGVRWENGKSDKEWQNGLKDAKCSPIWVE